MSILKINNNISDRGYIYIIKDKDKVENLNDRKHIAIKAYIERLSTSNKSFKNIYGEVVKINNCNCLYEDNSLIGDMHELDKYPELKCNN